MIVSPGWTRRAAAPLIFISPQPGAPAIVYVSKARAVVDVEHVDLLVLADVGRLEQVGVDRDRAHVVQVGVGDRRAVDLGLEHGALHEDQSPSWVWWRGLGGCRSAGRRRRGPLPRPARRFRSIDLHVRSSWIHQLDVLGSDVELVHRGYRGRADGGGILGRGRRAARGLEPADQRKRASALVSRQPFV